MLVVAAQMIKALLVMKAMQSDARSKAGWSGCRLMHVARRDLTTLRFRQSRRASPIARVQEQLTRMPVDSDTIKLPWAGRGGGRRAGARCWWLAWKDDVDKRGQADCWAAPMQSTLCTLQCLHPPAGLDSPEALQGWGRDTQSKRLHVRHFTAA